MENNIVYCTSVIYSRKPRFYLEHMIVGTYTEEPSGNREGGWWTTQ